MILENRMRNRSTEEIYAGHEPSEVNFDVPLKVDSALAQDKLSREGFAKIAAAALRNVPSSAGLVVSIEGAWGSGKTSALAMIEALLRVGDTSDSPLIVHFNPWLVGEKDALLRHFLSRIASVVKLNDHSRDGEKVAKEIKAYAKVFDLVKLIPGAEPWASMIKSVVEATGNATDAISELKPPDLDAYKLRVEEALRRLDRPIIVFIDDIDRLFPLEVFEMVRIIKSVGGLPRLGYVVAWDSAYVIGALDKLGVPFATSYLDKIVQVRMPLPSLSLVARRKLINEALSELDPETLRQRFRGQDERLATLYHSGLRDLLEQPRDFARVFNAVRVMEPLLRDEIVFADILGLAALSVKAPIVFDLLKNKPSLFVGPHPNELMLREKSEQGKELENEERKLAYGTATLASAVQRVVHFLFPRVAAAEDSISLGQGTYVNGNISHPAKLAIALQRYISDGDVSIKAARQYLQHPEQRQQILNNLTSDNCYEFIDLIGEVGEALQGENFADIDDLCLSIARMVEAPLFVERARANREVLHLRSDTMALRAVGLLIGTKNKSRMQEIAKLITTDPIALSCAAQIAMRSYAEGRNEHPEEVKLTFESRTEILCTVSKNVADAAKNDHLFEKNGAGLILHVMARLAPTSCPSLFEIMLNVDPTLDRFALHYLEDRWSSTKGASYSLPEEKDLHDVFCPLETLKAHAAQRLRDTQLQNPGRAAWRSVIEGKRLYGVDGTEAK
jgi:hypothetical protein